MVVKVNGQVAVSRRAPAWPVWIGPLALVSLYLMGYVVASYHQAWGFAPHLVAMAHTAALTVLAVPFLRLVRDVNVGRFGIEAHFFRGTSRYLRFYEIRSVSIHRHALVPSRMCVEDVYGRKLNLRGDLSLLAGLSAAIRRSALPVR